MSEQKLFFDDVAEGDWAPECSHQLTRTDLVMYAGASGDFNPMHTDEVKADQKEFFRLLYNLLVDKDRGPRLPTLIVALGPARVRTLLAN